jgi:pimeloyl-ACP methyl ester carboxylesterase
MDVRELELVGYEGAAVPCVFHEPGRTRVAVVFPGAIRSGGRLGGSPARPDLHYTRALLLEVGFGVLEVWWDAETKPDGNFEWYRDNVFAAVTAADDERVRLLVGRSIGSAALANVPELNQLASLWIAPLTYAEPVRDALAAWRGPKLVVVGDRDESFVPVDGVETVLVPGGDHGFNVGDAVASARALADALERVKPFVSAAAG